VYTVFLEGDRASEKEEFCTVWKMWIA